MTHTTQSTSIPPTAAEPVDEFDEPTLAPEAAPVLAAAGVQALAVKLFTLRALAGELAAILTVVMVSMARRARSGRRERWYPGA